MHKFALILAAMLGLCASAFGQGQDVPRVEVFGGYSYLNFDTSGVRNALLSIGIPTTVASRTNTNGWEGSLAYNFSRWGGVEANISGHYKGDCEGVIGLTCSNLSFMGGPRLTYRRGRLTAFAHGLFGGDRVSLSASSSTISGALLGTPIAGFSASVYETKLAIAAGGGADYALGKRASIRIAQVDYIMTRHFGEFGISHQNNFRVSAGVVFRLGATRATEVRTPNGAPKPPTQTGPVQTGPAGEAALLGVLGYPTEVGFWITSVRPGSPAAQMFLKAGDVIVKIDGHAVHSSHDIDSEIAASTGKTLKVSCLIQTGLGMMPSEREAKMR